MSGKEYKGFPYVRFFIFHICVMLAFHYLHGKILQGYNLKENCNCGSSTAVNPFQEDEEMSSRAHARTNQYNIIFKQNAAFLRTLLTF